jgi:hypothetical protein
MISENAILDVVRDALRTHVLSGPPHHGALRFLWLVMRRQKGPRITLALPVASPSSADAAPLPDGVRFGAACRSVTVGGTEYQFSAKRAAVVRALYDAWCRGEAAVSAADLAKAVGLSHHRIDNVFRGEGKPHPAWGTLIVKTRPGFYALNLGTATPGKDGGE